MDQLMPNIQVPECTGGKKIRRRNCSLVALFTIVCGSLVYLMNHSSSDAWHQVVEKTHNQIRQIPDQVKELSGVGVKEDLLLVDNSYLELLGLTKEQLSSEKLSKTLQVVDSYAEPVHPVICTASDSKSFHNLVALIDQISSQLQKSSSSSTFRLVVFDLGLTHYEMIELLKHCNKTNHCSVRQMDFEKLPSHVHSLYVGAYKPIAIQWALIDYKAVVWLDADTQSLLSVDKLLEAIDFARKRGMAVWLLQNPTSALTHPKMFNYFHTRPSNFYFVPLVRTDHMILFDSRPLREFIMQPWVKCSLVKGCMAPLGSRSKGCDLERKPYFTYTGCHGYDMSAFSIVLNHKDYLAQRDFFYSYVVFSSDNQTTNGVFVPHSAYFRDQNVPAPPFGASIRI